MRFDRADRQHALGRTLAAILAVLTIALVGCSGDTSIPPPAAPTQAGDSRVAQALKTISALESALRAADRTAAASLGAGPAEDLLGDAAANVTRLGLVDVALRLVQERGTGTSPESWQAVVSVEYRIRDWDDDPTRVETTFTFTPQGDAQVITAVGASDGRTPLWLAGPVTPVVAGRTLVLARGNDGDRESRLARRAVLDVIRVIPSWKGRLVIESPATEEEFNRALGVTREVYANIAAVTASVDGSVTGGSPVHVFLNPALFARLGPRAAQIVVSHESTHVATLAPYTSGMPTWLLEGFADYVALVRSGIGVQTAAAQILAQLRKDGLPEDLPTDEDLSPTATSLGAAYEEAWLVTRFLAAEYGEAKLIAFYQAIDGGAGVEEAFDTVLGTSQERFVAGWRADLRTLVSAAPRTTRG